MATDGPRPGAACGLLSQSRLRSPDGLIDHGGPGCRLVGQERLDGAVENGRVDLAFDDVEHALDEVD